MDTKKISGPRNKARAEKPWFGKPSKKVSKRMSRVKSFDTGLEKSMESLLKSRKIKYEKQPRLPGHPDFLISGTKILVFCDSSFWHGRRKNELDGSAFKKNKEFWRTKLSENRKRDVRTNRKLRKLGWHVLRFSDADVLKSPEKVCRRLLKEVEKNA